MIDEARLRGSSLLAGIAEGVVATALPLLIAGLTRDPLAVAGVVIAQHLPWMVVAMTWHRLPPGDWRTAVGLVHTVRALIVGYLGFRCLAGTDTVLLIHATALVIGLGEALTGAVEEETGDTSRLSTRGMLGLALVGMPLGGVLYEVYVAVPFLIDVLFFALAALFALFVPRPVVGPVVELRAKPHLHPATRGLAVVAFCASFARSTVLGVLVLFALDPLGLGAPAFGLLLAALSAATAAGAWVAPEAGAALGLRTGFAVAGLLAAAALVTAAEVADPARPHLGAIALGVAWATATTGSVLLRALLPVVAGQQVTGPALRAIHLVEWAGICLGAMAGGWLARRTGIEDVVRAAGAAWVVAAASVATVVRGRTVAGSARTDSVNWLDAA